MEEKGVVRSIFQMADDQHPTHKKPIGYGDSLPNCFEIISGLLHHRVSATSLKAGISIGPSGLTPSLFLQAVERFKFKAKVIQRRLNEIRPELLPCILILKEGHTCVLVSLNQNHAIIYLPEDKTNPITIPITQLEALYTNRAVLIAHRPLENLAQSKSPLDWFWGTLKIYRGIYTQVILASFFINSLLLAGTLYAMNIYDRVLPNKAFDTLYVLSIGVFIAYIFDFVLRITRGYFIDTSGKNIDILLGRFLYERILGLQFAHRPASSGGLAHHLREFESVREFFASTTIVSIIDVPFALLFLGAITMISGTMAIVPIVAILLIVGINYIMQPSTKGAVTNFLAQLEYKHGILMESLSGLETVKAMNAEGRMLHKWEQSVASTAHASNKLYWLSLISSNISFLLQNVAYVFLLILGVYENSEGNLTVGGLIAATILTTRAIASMGNVVAMVAKFNQAYSSLKILDKIINLPAERPPSMQYIHRDKLQGDIEFVEVEFSYLDQKIKTLNNMSFKIQAGEKVAISGAVGSGKTTIEKLILGLYHPTSGTILLDEIDSRQLDPAEVRASIGYVPQDVFLFRGTLRENITIAHYNVTEEQLLKATKIAGVDDFARLHPLGYDMLIGEGGAGLSGGQRQAVAIARALINNPPILIFDEPTSAMDIESEFRLIKRLKQIIIDKTVILVTHRNSLLTLVNRVLLIEQGRVFGDESRETIRRRHANHFLNSLEENINDEETTNDGPMD